MPLTENQYLSPVSRQPPVSFLYVKEDIFRDSFLKLTPRIAL
jgi:hypothetical protein